MPSSSFLTIIVLRPLLALLAFSLLRRFLKKIPRLHPPRAGGRVRGEDVRRDDAAAGHARVRSAERGTRGVAVFEVGIAIDGENNEHIYIFAWYPLGTHVS